MDVSVLAGEPWSTVGGLWLPLVVLAVTVMVVAIGSLVVPSHRQPHLLAVLDRLVELVRAFRGSGK
jgi:hypothetical protein